MALKEEPEMLGTLWVLSVLMCSHSGLSCHSVGREWREHVDWDMAAGMCRGQLCTLVGLSSSGCLLGPAWGTSFLEDEGAINSVDLHTAGLEAASSSLLSFSDAAFSPSSTRVYL